MFRGVKSIKSRFKSSKRASEVLQGTPPGGHAQTSQISAAGSACAGNGNGDPLEHETDNEYATLQLNPNTHSTAASVHNTQSRPQTARSQAPSRPPRPESPGIAALVASPSHSPHHVHSSHHSVISFHSSPRPSSFAIPKSRDSVDYLVPEPGSSHPPSQNRGNAWFVPVAVLDRTVYPFEYQFGGTIGEGGFGKVLLALNIETRQQCAIKVVVIRRLRSRRETTSVANEIKVFWKVSQTESPFLARPANVRNWYWQYRGNIHFVMEYYNGGDLGRGADRHPELRDPRQFKLMVAEVVIAILALHDMHIIHHDVKPPNILVDSDGHCVLTDYGGSCFTSDDDQAHWQKDATPIFTIRYTAPEVFANGPAGRSYGTAADFWSLGVTLFELATGRDLINESDDDLAVYTIRDGQIDYQQLLLLSAYPGLRQFVSALLVMDPALRLQGYNVKTHDYFSEFNQSEWTAIHAKQRPPFRTNKQLTVNPRNTSYEYVERPGENLLEDANEDIVCRWLAEDGIGMPHHRDSDYHRRHRNNARLGLPERARRQSADIWARDEANPSSI